MFKFLRRKNKEVEENTYKVIGGKKENMNIDIKLMKDNSKKLSLIHALGGIRSTSKGSFYFYINGDNKKGGGRLRRPETMFIDGCYNVQFSFLEDDIILALYTDRIDVSDRRHHEYLKENYKDIYDMYEEKIFPYFPFANDEEKWYTGLFWIKDGTFFYIADTKEQVEEMISEDLKYVINNFNMEDFFDDPEQIDFTEEEQRLFFKLWNIYKKGDKKVDARELVENYKHPIDEFSIKEYIIKRLEVDLEPLGFDVKDYNEEEAWKYLLEFMENKSKKAKKNKF